MVSEVETCELVLVKVTLRLGDGEDQTVCPAG